MCDSDGAKCHRAKYDIDEMSRKKRCKIHRQNIPMHICSAEQPKLFQHYSRISFVFSPSLPPSLSMACNVAFVNFAIIYYQSDWNVFFLRIFFLFRNFSYPTTDLQLTHCKFDCSRCVVARQTFDTWKIHKNWLDTHEQNDTCDAHFFWMTESAFVSFTSWKKYKGDKQTCICLSMHQQMLYSKNLENKIIWKICGVQIGISFLHVYVPIVHPYDLRRSGVVASALNFRTSWSLLNTWLHSSAISNTPFQLKLQITVQINQRTCIQTGRWTEANKKHSKSIQTNFFLSRSILSLFWIVRCERREKKRDFDL